MHILILGGSVFVGRAIADEAVARGHKVTVFNRGTKPAPEGTTVATGDRLAAGGFAALDGLTFDAVVDTWAEDAEAVTKAVEALRGRFGHFTYVSTVSVYDFKQIQPSQMYAEDAALYDVEAENAAKAAYQYNKRRGEIEAEKAGVPVFLPRPGIILGPYESLGGYGARLPWWLERYHRGGRAVAPGPEDLETKFIDVRDLAVFIVSGVEKGFTGPYNLMGASPTVGHLWTKINEVAGGHAELVWKTPEEITAVGVKHWLELPMWYPAGSHDYATLSNWDLSKALAAGLTNRSSDETVQDTWDWMQKDNVKPPPPPSAGGVVLGLTAEHEEALLK